MSHGDLDTIRFASQYFATLLRSHPEHASWLWDQRNLHRRWPVAELHQELVGAASLADDWSCLMTEMRAFKQRHFLRIGGRDFLGLADLVETTAQVSDLASVALQVGIHALGEHPDWWLENGEHQRWAAVESQAALTVIGLGKLGGQELNYVSDIDILFLYEARSGGITGEVVPVLNRFCQSLCRLIGDNHEGDRVFVVDLRLRPQGKDGPLVPSVGAASDHYLQFGRPWERQMLLKARPAAGDRMVGRAFIQQVRPFVFRRFLDFQALDELRSMRDRILAEAARPKPGHDLFDVKLGIGGIREVEFLVQSLQLIYGGREPELDEPGTLRCLDKLARLGILAQDVRDRLRDAYIFLRRVEHWVQLDQNRQTQKLPKSEEALGRMATVLGFGGDAGRFRAALAEHCGGVHEQFTSLFQSGQSRQPEPVAPGDDRSLEDPLADLPGLAPDLLRRLRGKLEAVPEGLRRESPRVLRRLAPAAPPDLLEKACNRLDLYLAKISRRPGLLKVFETPGSWLASFLEGLMTSELLAALLSHGPALVEGVATSGGQCPSHDHWTRRGEEVLARAGGYEEGFEWLRRLKNERTLQLALALLGGGLGHGAVEGELTRLADFVIRHSLRRVLQELGLTPDLPLAILGLGKLGSGEMGLLSDLDLVFVYDPLPGESSETIPEACFRLIQRLMRMLSTPLQEGPGYPVDARLRPTGTYGPLVVTRGSWLEYYMHQADLWEIQALIRMRCVAGHAALGRAIEDDARRICYQERDPRAVWERLCHLRQRMQRERADEREGAVDIKLGEGGLTDFEFLVQGIQMTQGFRQEALRARSVRDALEPALACLDPAPAVIRDAVLAFRTLRALEHRLRLHSGQASSRIQESTFMEMKASGHWPPSPEETRLEEWQDLLVMRRRVRALFRSCCPELQ
ncbi:MAG: bifunctional [glutamate--ammonia ligase]-adenylyl-L-tyrosine phosphorylase/[glutamate--ammonia-ligase] adenylyltransferase [Syntrophobacteraceae bacterium]|jgi:glutamate-ammonia-ligase adenylyltransferase|nr:bifunctional [glutamate--ammonia ligase]-adenylyl-L-tyrosine phosphorylase/[glutamate--ammonia-ligase] adenylyltransferase [Syntrophobacteraceae bacterium]